MDEADREKIIFAERKRAIACAMSVAGCWAEGDRPLPLEFLTQVANSIWGEKKPKYFGN